MKISSHGGVIASASLQSAHPLLEIGDLTAIERIVLAFQQAGVFPIVVLSHKEEEEAIRYQLSSKGVVFLPVEAAGSLELFDCVKGGLAFLRDVCERIVFTPVSAPIFSPATLCKLMKTGGKIVSPSHNGKSGHPIVIASDVVPQILAYQGGNGLRGAIHTMRGQRVWLEVEDASVLYAVGHGEEPAGQVQRQSKEFLHLAARLSLEKDETVFDARAKLLMLLILKTHSVRTACRQMGLSYSKAWSLLNHLEEALSLKLVARKQGGVKGGNTTLTKEGIQFLSEYQKLEEELLFYTQKAGERLKSMFLP